jgi:branched-chain amino acid transport system permease protein
VPKTRLTGRTRWLIVGVVVLILFLVPLFLKNAYYLDLMLWIFVFALFATCVHQVAVVNRLLFGAGAFIGIGAYTSTILVMNFGVSFWPALLLAGLVSAVVAFLIGLPILRVEGVYFAIITWCLGEVCIAIYKGTPWFGGVDGIHSISPPSIFGAPFVGPVPYYYLSLGLLVITLFFFYRLGKSRFGQDLRAIGFSDALAASLGIDVPRYRLMCFAISCFFLGLGGSFYAHYLTSIEPYFFGISLSSEVFAFIVIGGLSSLWGGLIGSTVMTIIPEWMHAIEQVRPLLYGAMIMFVIVVMPGGLISLPHQVRLWRRGKLGEAER